MAAANQCTHKNVCVTGKWAQFCLVSWTASSCSQPAICLLEMPAPSLPLLSAFPASAQPHQLFWLQVFTEFFIQFWLWNSASYCCLGLAFPFIHYQKTVIKTSHVTIVLLQGRFAQPRIIARPCWLQTMKGNHLRELWGE